MKNSLVFFLILIIGSLAATEEQQIEAVQGLVSRVLGKVLVFTSSEFAAIRGQVWIPHRCEGTPSSRVLRHSEDHEGGLRRD